MEILERSNWLIKDVKGEYVYIENLQYFMSDQRDWLVGLGFMLKLLYYGVIRSSPRFGILQALLYYIYI